MPSLVTERIESVKSGIIGAGGFTLAELITTIATFAIASTTDLTNFFPIILNEELLIKLAIGAVSGFLFGVTYRYIIRNDRNPHLNDGAVLAFALVRALALIENNLNLMMSELLSLAVLVLQNILCFAIARVILDLAIKRKLIQPFW